MMKHSFVWTGRDDNEEIGPSQRWHQKIRPLENHSNEGVTLVGFASDEGVRRNKGRAGAAKGPDALRSALANLPIMGESELFDAGNIHCEAGKLETAQNELADVVCKTIRNKNLAIVLGGGHEVAWGTFQGITQAGINPNRLLVVNFDAHFDLRAASTANSGTPFRQMHEHCIEQKAAFNYRIFGISRFSNTQALFDRADSIGAQYWLDEQLQFPKGLESAKHALAEDLSAHDAVYITICLDVLPGYSAPGVSAPAALGVPLANIEYLIDQILSSGKLVAVDLAELNPELDRDNLTAKVAARLVARIARSKQSR